MTALISSFQRHLDLLSTPNPHPTTAASATPSPLSPPAAAEELRRLRAQLRAGNARVAELEAAGRLREVRLFWGVL
jgi:hypothetical protein